MSQSLTNIHSFYFNCVAPPIVRHRRYACSSFHNSHFSWTSTTIRVGQPNKNRQTYFQTLFYRYIFTGDPPLAEYTLIDRTYPIHHSQLLPKIPKFITLESLCLLLFLIAYRATQSPRYHHNGRNTTIREAQPAGQASLLCRHVHPETHHRYFYQGHGLRQAWPKEDGAHEGPAAGSWKDRHSL